MTASAERGMLLKGIIPGAGLVWRDMMRIIRGASAFVQYLMTREYIDVGLGYLGSDASVAVRGQPSRYIIRVANVRDKVWRGMVVIDIISAEGSNPRQERYASFATQLTVEPRSATAIEIQYDWLAQVAFVIDGSVSSPDEFCQGRVTQLAQRWAVHAVLMDMRRERLDQLTIYQRMEG
jgi:hypothetical protein